MVTADKLNKIFSVPALTVIGWRRPIASLAPSDAVTVDLAVTVRGAASLIALGYFKSELEARGVQNIRDGETRVFRNVYVKEGDDLFVALNAPAVVTVSTAKAEQFDADAVTAIELAPPCLAYVAATRAALKTAAINAAVKLGLSSLAGRPLYELIAGVSGKLDAAARNALAITAAWMTDAEHLEAGRIPPSWSAVTAANVEPRVEAFLESGADLVDNFALMAKVSYASIPVVAAWQGVQAFPGALVKVIKEAAKVALPSGALLLLGFLAFSILKDAGVKKLVGK